MAYYAIAPLLCALVQNELYMHLYIHQVASGAPGENPNQLVVINPSNPQGFGVTAITDWPITDGPGPNANIVGRAQGLHSHSSLSSDSWYTSMNIVFEDTRFNGSTLQVMGTIPEDGEWSITGGTGELVLARGIVEHKVLQAINYTRTYELKIHAFYSPMNSDPDESCNCWKLGA